MKTDLLAQTTDDAGASDATSEYSLLSSESPDGENMEKLREKIINQDVIIRDFETKLTEAEKNIINQNEKIKIYEATIKDKNDLIELMKETKEFAIKQLKNENAFLQIALDFSKNPTSNKNDANAADSAEFEKKSTEIADFQTLQKQLKEIQSQNEALKYTVCQLKSRNFKLKSKLDENIREMNTLEAKSATDAEELRAKIAELEKNAEIYRVKSEEKNAMLAEGASNAINSQVTDAPFVLLNHSKVPNIKFIKIGDEDKPAIVENIPTLGTDWIVILRRFDGSVDFSKYWSNSVGDLSGEFWIGFKSIHKLTSSVRHELYIQLEDFDGVTAYARYDNFVVGNFEENYILKSLGYYSGNAGDALRSHVKSKMNYKEFDKKWRYWWFSNNNECCLTGEYKKSKEALTSELGMYWGNWNLGKRYPLKACKMLIRPYPK
nr:fibrinogen-like protein 1 [Drosophila kikkawai]